MCFIQHYVEFFGDGRKWECVDPSNASYLEMLAYATYSDVQEMTSDAYGKFLQAANGVNGDIIYDSDSINEKKDISKFISENLTDFQI